MNGHRSNRNSGSAKPPQGNHGRREGSGDGSSNPDQNQVFAPYNFVPLAETVWLPGWGHLVTQDRPFRDGWSGELTIRITAKTPLLVGGGASCREKQGNGLTTVDFFKDIDGAPAIPGSSLKGLFRNVAEILSFSRLSWIDDRRLGVRDLTPGAKFYQNRITTKASSPKECEGAFKALSRSGFLYFKDRKWWLLPCEHGRVEHSVLRGQNGGTPYTHELKKPSGRKKSPIARLCISGEIYPGLKEDEDILAGSKELKELGKKRKILEEFRFLEKDESWLEPSFSEKQSMISSKDGRIRVNPAVQEALHTGSNNKQLCYRKFETDDLHPDDQNPPAPSNFVPGTIVLTGYIQNKHREFIFYDSPEGYTREPICLSDDAGGLLPAIQGFLDIHDEYRNQKDTPWGYWRDRLLRREIGPDSANAQFLPGIPVFYLTENATEQQVGPIEKIGLAQMFKMAYDYTIADMASHSSKDHVLTESEDDPFDMAELLFGAARPRTGKAIRGRVSFGLASIDQTTQRMEPEESRVVLNSPKPNYYPFYVEQDVETSDPRNGDFVNTSGPDIYKAYMTRRDKNGRRIDETAAIPEPRLAGWKRYLPREAPKRPPNDDGTASISTNLRLLPAGTSFAASIQIHNLRPAEIGCLVTALTWSVTRDIPDRPLPPGAHLLGMGKPYGYGRIEIEVTSATLEPNDLAGRTRQSADLSSHEALAQLAEWRSDFEQQMDDHLKKQAGVSWARTPQVRAMRQLADPAAVQALASHEQAYLKLIMDNTKNPFVKAKGKKDNRGAWTLQPRALPRLPLND